MDGETAVLIVRGLNNAGEDGTEPLVSCFDWLVARDFLLAPFPFLLACLVLGAEVIALPSLLT